MVEVVIEAVYLQDVIVKVFYPDFTNLERRNFEFEIQKGRRFTEVIIPDFPSKFSILIKPNGPSPSLKLSFTTSHPLKISIESTAGTVIFVIL